MRRPIENIPIVVVMDIVQVAGVKNGALMSNSGTKILGLGLVN